MTSLTGNPFSAYQIADERSSENGFVPKRERSASQPATAPGTVTEKMPLLGIRVRPRSARSCGVRPVGAQPEALSPCSFPVFAS